MISLIVCSDDEAAIQRNFAHHRENAGASVETVHVRSTEERPGLCAAYAEGVARAQGDVLVFTHDDAFMITPRWGVMVETFFASQDAIGVLGVAGSQRIVSERPSWFHLERPHVFGKVIHEIEGRSVLSLYSREDGTREVVVVDGVWFAARRSLFDDVAFDAKTFDGFHFYDLDFSMQARKHTKLAVTTDLLVKHRSAGRYDVAWEKYAERFRAKWASELPASCAPNDAVERTQFQSVPLDQAMEIPALARIRAIGRAPRTEPPAWREKGMIVVTGMHRSGTSLITGLLDLCGYGVGDTKQLLGENQPRFDNMKGHFESRDLVQIDDALLAAAGGSWNRLPDGTALESAADTFALPMQHFLEDFDGHVIKDPRLSVTLASWRAQGMQLRHVVLCLRHPLQVARSLQRRDAMDLNEGLQLWYEHNRRLVDALEGASWSVIDYDRIRGDVVDTFWPLIEELGDGPTREEVVERIEGFFDERLDHSASNDVELPASVQSLYDDLRDRARGD